MALCTYILIALANSFLTTMRDDYYRHYNISVTVASTPSLPVITEEPRPIYTSLSNSAIMRCIASGYPQPTIQWHKDGIPITGETSTVLIFGEVSISDRGYYHCTALNTQGRDTSASVILSVTNIRQYTVPVLTTLSGYVDATTDIRTALPDFVMELNIRVAGSAVTGNIDSTVSIYAVELPGVPVPVPSSP